jgi:hypothetical protein
VRIQAFIPDWPGEKQHAKQTAALIETFCESVTILDDPKDYFTDQWEKARSLFTGDVLLWVMADVYPPDNVRAMFGDIEFWLRPESRIGIYAPNVEWTGQQLFTYKLREIHPNVYEVPAPEMLCWALKKDVLDTMPHVDPDVNRLGWGIEYLAVAAARSINQVAVRDYNFCAMHPNSTNYGNNTAGIQYDNWLNSLDSVWRKRVDEVVEERHRVGVRLRNLIMSDDDNGNLLNIVRRNLEALGTDIVRTLEVPASDLFVTGALKNINDVYIFTKKYPLDLIIAAANTGYVDNIFMPIGLARQGNYNFTNRTTHGVECGHILAREVKSLLDSKK